MSKAPAGWVPLQGPTWGLWPVSPPPPSTEDEDVLRTHPAQTLLQLAPGSRNHERSSCWFSPQSVLFRHCGHKGHLCHTDSVRFLAAPGPLTLSSERCRQLHTGASVRKVP